MAPLRLSAVAHFPATVFVSVFGVVTATVFMDMTGGGLKPYEMQSARVAWAQLIGDASAAEALSRPAPAYTPEWRAPTAPRPPSVLYAASEETLGDGLLGGLAADVGAGETSPFLRVVSADAYRCPPTERWIAAAGPDRRDAAT